MVKINPKAIHMDPLGIYLFPENFNTKGNWHTYRFKYTVDVPHSLRVLDLADLDRPACLSLLDKLGAPANEEFQKQIQTAPTPADPMWEWLTQHAFPTNKKALFNQRLRDAGYDAVFDDTGSIHGYEVQLLVLDPRKIKVVDTEERTRSGYDVIKKALFEVEDVCKKYGKVETKDPKKKFDGFYQQNILEATIVCYHKNYDHANHSGIYASWVLRSLSSNSDAWQGKRDENERLPRDRPHSLVQVSLRYSNPSLGYGSGFTVELHKPDWDGLKREVDKTMAKVWEEKK